MKKMTKTLAVLTTALIAANISTPVTTEHTPYQSNLMNKFYKQVEANKVEINNVLEVDVSDEEVEEETTTVGSTSEIPVLPEKTENIVKEPETVRDIVISEHETLLSVPANHPFKSWERYNMITCVTSPQYKLQQIAYTCPNGLRAVNGAYCVAIGTGFNLPVGSYFTLIMKNGSEINCIVGDIKADAETDPTRKYHLYDGSVVEFIVDYDVLSDYAKIRGDISCISPEFEGDVAYFKVVK